VLPAPQPVQAAQSTLLPADILNLPGRQAAHTMSLLFVPSTVTISPAGQVFHALQPVMAIAAERNCPLGQSVQTRFRVVDGLTLSYLPVAQVECV
jgi:hypothetical protein